MIIWQDTICCSFSQTTYIQSYIYIQIPKHKIRIQVQFVAPSLSQTTSVPLEMLTRIVISEMDRGDGQRVQTCIGKQGVVLQMYLVSECICILIYNVQNVAINRFILGSLTLLNNPHCHSFDFQLHFYTPPAIFSPRTPPICDLSPKTGLKHHLDHWPVHSLRRCAVPQVSA